MIELVSLFKRAAMFGDKTAIIDADQKTSYAQLLKRSEAIAAALLSSKDDLKEQHIAFAAPAGSDYTAIQWGIWRAGGAAVPLNIDATLPEIQHCTDTANVSHLIALTSTAEKIRPLCQEVGIKLLLLDDIDMGRTTLLPEVSLDRRAMMLFTSGTTNKPKGVVTTHRNIEAQVKTLINFWQWQSTDVIPLFLPMHHVHGIINILTCALWSGATVEAFAKGFDLPKILARVSSDAYSVFMAVPTIYVKIIKVLEAMPEDKRLIICEGFNRMRLMISGSAALPIKIHNTWQNLTGQVLLERYGMTEIGMGLSNPMDGERRPGSVGVALPGVEVQLVAEDGSVVEGEGNPGEIWIRGDNVFSEYWQNPKATKESFTGDWFKTGDMAVREQGYYRIMGRLSVDIIKSGGYKLSALEIENYLLAHDDISECAVIGVEDETWGEVVAVVAVLEPGTALDLPSLQAWSKDKMSNYKTPRILRIIKSLPRNAMGKVTKPDVKKLFN